jgi:hypothetical protein
MFDSGLVIRGVFKHAPRKRRLLNDNRLINEDDNEAVDARRSCWKAAAVVADAGAGAGRIDGAPSIATAYRRAGITRGIDPEGPHR